MKSLENIRNIAVGLGVMVLFPIAVHVGTRLIIKEPSSEVLWEFKSQLKAQAYKEKEKEYDTKMKECEKINFYVKTILGLIAIAVGTLIPIPYLGMGFIFGGVICLSSGYFGYWNNLNDMVKFISLIIGLLILIGSAYRSMRK